MVRVLGQYVPSLTGLGQGVQAVQSLAGLTQGGGALPEPNAAERIADAMGQSTDLSKRIKIEM